MLSPQRVKSCAVLSTPLTFDSYFYINTMNQSNLLGACLHHMVWLWIVFVIQKWFGQQSTESFGPDHITHIESFGAVSPSVKQKYLRQLRKWKEANEVDIYIYLQSIDPKHVNASCHRQRTSLLHNSGKDIFTKHFLFSVAYTILLANLLYHY